MGRDEEDEGEGRERRRRREGVFGNFWGALIVGEREERLEGRKKNQEVNERERETEGERVLDLRIERRSLRARRSRELQVLRGGRLVYSLFLELSDVLGPVLKTLFKKLSEIISFLLVALIGRALGLIYRGIRQSFRTPKIR